MTFSFVTTATTPGSASLKVDHNFKIRKAQSESIDSDASDVFQIVNDAYSCDQGSDGIRFMKPGMTRFTDVQETIDTIKKFSESESDSGTNNSSIFFVIENLDQNEICGCIGVQMIKEKPKANIDNCGNHGSQQIEPIFSFGLFAVHPALRGSPAKLGQKLFNHGLDWAINQTNQNQIPNLIRIQTVHHRIDLWKVCDEEKDIFDRAISIVLKNVNENVNDDNMIIPSDPDFQSLFYPDLVYTRQYSNEDPTIKTPDPESESFDGYNDALPPYYKLRTPFKAADSDTTCVTSSNSFKFAYKGYRCVGMVDSGFPLGKVITRPAAWIILERSIDL